MLLLTTGALAAELAGIVIASQRRHVPRQPVYPVRATPEAKQLSRVEPDVIAEMIKAQLTGRVENCAVAVLSGAAPFPPSPSQTAG
jgi:hypothetical protein